MITVRLIGAGGLHLEALAAALAEDGEVECLLLSSRDLLAPGHPRTEDGGETVILLDFSEEQRRNGKLFPRLRRQFPKGKVVYLVDTDDAGLGKELLNRGAWGMFPKSDGLLTLRKAVRAVAAGEIWADRKCSSLLIRTMTAGNRREDRRETQPEVLSKRERQILALVAAGMKNRQVAGKLSISEMTVKVHLNNIYRKIAVDNRLQAALFAIHNGIVPARIPID